MEETNHKAALFKKIVEVRKTIDAFHKDTKGYQYTYVSGSQILSKIKAKMDETGLILVPIMGEITTSEITNKKGNPVYILQGDMTYQWIDSESGETYEVPWKLYGSQDDDIAKAFGTATTYSERYFLLKFFGIPTDDDDPDAKQQKPQSRPQGQQQRSQSNSQQSNQKPAQKAQKSRKDMKEEQSSDAPKATAQQKNKLRADAKKLADARNTQVAMVFQHLKIGDLEAITQAQATEALGTLEKWNEQASNSKEKQEA